MEKGTETVRLNLYTELLLNIRSITIVGTVISQLDKQVTAELSGSKNYITLSCTNQSISCKIPATVAKPFSTKTSINARKSHKLEARIATADIYPHILCEPEDTEEQIPWPASALTTQTELYCRHCNATLVSRSKIKEWKALPSANWAEMMDFWHCHKPPEPESKPSSTLSQKGYAATNSIKPTPGIGLVDNTALFCSSDDCMNVTVSSSSPCGPP